MIGRRYGRSTLEDTGTREGVSAEKLCTCDVTKYRTPTRRETNVVQSFLRAVDL